MSKKLHKSRNRMLFGVCGGLAEFFNIDPTIIRIAVVVVTLLTKWPVPLAYIICALIFPERSIDEGYGTDYYDDEHLKSANINGDGKEYSRSEARDDAENRRQFAEHADKLRSDEEFNSYFRK